MSTAHKNTVPRLASLVMLAIAGAASMATSPGWSPGIYSHENMAEVITLDDEHPTATLKVAVRFPLHDLEQDELTGGELTVRGDILEDSDDHVSVTARGGLSETSSVAKRMYVDQELYLVTGNLQFNCSAGTCSQEYEVLFTKVSTGTVRLQPDYGVAVNWENGVDEEAHVPGDGELDVSSTIDRNRRE